MSFTARFKVEVAETDTDFAHVTAVALIEDGSLDQQNTIKVSYMKLKIVMDSPTTFFKVGDVIEGYFTV